MKRSRPTPIPQRGASAKAYTSAVDAERKRVKEKGKIRDVVETLWEVTSGRILSVVLAGVALAIVGVCALIKMRS